MLAFLLLYLMLLGSLPKPLLVSSISEGNQKQQQSEQLEQDMEIMESGRTTCTGEQKQTVFIVSELEMKLKTEQYRDLVLVHTLFFLGRVLNQIKKNGIRFH